MKRVFEILTASLICLFVQDTFGQVEPDDSTSRYYAIQEIILFGKGSDKGLNNRVSATQIQNFNKHDVVEAVNLLPGVSITQLGARNEGSIMVRGFNSLRTPVFYDGIPIYTPYDGTFDLSRFNTFDIESISIDKGLVSVQYGPNTMGGAVNIISKKPIKKLDINGQSGLISAKGDMANGNFSSFNVGTRQNTYYALGSVSILDRKDFVLSSKFEPTNSSLQDVGKRNHAASQDIKLSGKVGYTPNETDEYSLSFIYQNANKAISPNVLLTGNSNWRDYPVYDKKSAYFKTKTLLAEKTFLHVTGYYDTYFNEMRQYDDNEYLLQNKNSSFASVYDDYALGGIINLTSEAIKNNVITVSVNQKFDVHREHNREIAERLEVGQNFKAGEPVQEYNDHTFFVGVEDVIVLNSSVKGILGLSYNTRRNTKAQEYGTHYDTGECEVLFDFPTGSNQAFDYKGGLVVEPVDNHKITLSASKRTRFASQKERYSSRFGSQVPNPGLKSEYAWVFDLTYSGEIGSVFQYEFSGFINDIYDAILVRTVGELDNGDPVNQNVNIGKAVSQGYELAFGYQPLSFLSFGANYSFIALKDKTGNDEKFTDMPNHKVIGYTKVDIPKIKSAFLISVEHYGKRYITSIGDAAPDFTLLHAKFSIPLISGISLDLSVRNLLDKDYYLALGYPREGRSFLTALSYNF